MLLNVYWWKSIYTWGKKNEPLEKQPEYYLDRMELALKNIQKHIKTKNKI